MSKKSKFKIGDFVKEFFMNGEVLFSTITDVYDKGGTLYYRIKSKGMKGTREVLVDNMGVQKKITKKQHEKALPYVPMTGAEAEKRYLANKCRH